MLTEAAAVVIGSGALGASTAFHLLAAGIGPVALIDQHAIGGETSPRAAGLTQQVRDSDLMTDLARRSVGKITNFSRDTGQPLVYFQSGSMKIARTPGHARQLRREVERGQRLGLEIDLIPEAEAARRNPFLRPRGITAVSFAKTDLYLEPWQIPRLYARAFAERGGVLLPHTRVNGLSSTDAAITEILTDQGPIRTRVVIDAAGAWTRLVGERCGARIGAVATRHQLFITEPIDGVDAMQPITRVIDCNVYMRPADGGLMLGGYEPAPVQADMANLPAGFSVADLTLDISVLRRLAEQIGEQFPIFRDVAIKEHRGGLPTMTADGEHILGPWPGLRGFYVVGGCCVGGLSIAPILGELLATWVVSGSPGLDLSGLAPGRRAVADLNEASLLEACRRNYAYHYWARETRPAEAAIASS
ncbi:MAG: NAD(P)/FAD-dependent oxidoreductase [Acetobacteraceae bacterium]